MNGRASWMSSGEVVARPAETLPEPRSHKSPPPDRTQGASRPIDMPKAARSTLFAFALTGIGLGLNYLLNIALARWYGPAAFGLYATGFAVMNALVVVVTMGFDAIVLREIPAERARGAEPAGWRIVLHAVAIVLAGGALVAGGLALLADPLSTSLFPGSPGIGPVLAWFAAALPAGAAGVVLLAGLQATHDVRFRLTLRYGIDPVMRFALGGLAFLLGASILGAVWAVVAASVVTAVVAALWLRRRMRPPAGLRPSAAPPRSHWPRLLRAAWPLTLASALAVIASRSDLVLLLGLTDSRQAGLYGGALVTAAIISIVLQVIETIMAPLLSDGIARLGARGIASLYRLALRWTTLLAVPLFLVFAIASDEIMALLGAEFRAAGSCFLILSAGHLVNALTGSANYVLLLGNRPKLVLANALLYAALIIGANIIAIPLWGLVGAAGAMLLALTAVNLARLVEVWLLFRIHPFSAASFGPILVGGLLLGAYEVLRAVGLAPNAWAAAAIAAVVYVVLVLLACLHQEDRAMLRKAWARVRR